MRIFNIISVAALGTSGVFAQTTGKLGDAPITTGNPVGKIAVATLPEEAFWKGSLDGNVKGSVTAKAGPGGQGIDYSVSFSNLPKEGGTFIYHIHVAPVPADGNCTSTLAHLDQTVRGEDPVCDSTKPQTCQQGDLSGKYGHINSTTSFSTTFHDDYTSLVEGDGAYFGNRSLVFHFANKTRISCANFTVIDANTTTPYPTGTGSIIKSSPTPTSSTTGIPVTGAATALNIAKNLAIAPVVALFLAML
ncbi:superoxide dismutase [Hypomontagnella submonticulosa]|nr:superoxide dismutase [Hypomontagnella submonticulosa]